MAGMMVLAYGPAQRALGAAEARIEITENTNEAIGGIGNDADDFRVKRRLCRGLGDGMYFDFASARCEQRETGQ